jgi:hypothetical protein
VAEDWREPFERALDADPPDQRVRRDLADHLAEASDPDAEPVRWLADHDKFPVFAEDDFEGPRWDWYTVNETVPVSCRVPGQVFFRLAGRALYPTRREAEADFCRAFYEAKAGGWDAGAG